MVIPTEADVIVIGGGAAGCVVAGRLAAADPTLEIIIVEAGRNNLEDQDIIKPGMCRIHLAPKVAPNATTMKAYIGKLSENLAGRKPIVPVAQILGGGSSVNYMMYTRASASDYDDWDTKGWATNDLLPLLRKCESYSASNLKPDTHGYSGPLAVSHGGCPVGIADEFLTAAQGRGYSIVDDAQDLKTSNAFARWAKWIDPVTGRRSDAAHGYVHPQMTKNTNLRLLVESTVSKIIIENGLATGIEYVPTIAIEGTTPLSSSIKARKLIVLSAGALSSPGILERSGVGAKKVLAAAGVAPIVDLPGVGVDYQDHTLLISVYKVANDAETCDDLGRLDSDALMKAEKEFLEGKGMLATNFVDVGGKLRPTEKELESFDAAFHKHWKDQFQDAEDKPVVFAGMINGFVGNHSLTGLTEGKYISIINMGLYPASHGFVHITSNDPHTDPEFDPGFLSHPADLTPMVWSYKLSRELVRRMPSYRGEVQAFHPQFPAGSTASVKAIDTDDITVREDIVYNNDDDEAIKRFCRARVTSTWHGLGTLPMKLRENGGVVDEELSVYGVTNLKVADLSICPNNVGSNTYSTALTIGEKCAILCGAYLGISNV